MILQSQSEVIRQVVRQLVYTSLLLIVTLCFTCGETKICSTINQSQNIMNMIVDDGYYQDGGDMDKNHSPSVPLKCLCTFLELPPAIERFPKPHLFLISLQDPAGQEVSTTTTHIHMHKCFNPKKILKTFCPQNYNTNRNKIFENVLSMEL